jgi:hypothetical protein
MLNHENNNDVEHIFASFKLRILKNNFLPTAVYDMKLVTESRKRWEKIQIWLEVIYEFILLGSFISVFFNSQVLTGLLIALVGALSRTIINCKSKREELLNIYNGYLKRFGYDNLIFNNNNDTENNNHDNDKEISEKVHEYISDLIQEKKEENDSNV